MAPGWSGQEWAKPGRPPNDRASSTDRSDRSWNRENIHSGYNNWMASSSWEKNSYNNASSSWDVPDGRPDRSDPRYRVGSQAERSRSHRGMSPPPPSPPGQGRNAKWTAFSPTDDPYPPTDGSPPATDVSPPRVRGPPTPPDPPGRYYNLSPDDFLVRPSRGKGIWYTTRGELADDDPAKIAPAPLYLPGSKITLLPPDGGMTNAEWEYGTTHLKRDEPGWIEPQRLGPHLSRLRREWLEDVRLYYQTYGQPEPVDLTPGQKQELKKGPRRIKVNDTCNTHPASPGYTPPPTLLKDWIGRFWVAPGDSPYWSTICKFYSSRRDCEYGAFCCYRHIRNTTEEPYHRDKHGEKRAGDSRPLRDGDIRKMLKQQASLHRRWFPFGSYTDNKGVVRNQYYDYAFVPFDYDTESKSYMASCFIRNMVPILRTYQSRGRTIEVEDLGFPSSPFLKMDLVMGDWQPRLIVEMPDTDEHFFNVQRILKGLPSEQQEEARRLGYHHATLLLPEDLFGLMPLNTNTDSFEWLMMMRTRKRDALQQDLIRIAADRALKQKARMPKSDDSDQSDVDSMEFTPVCLADCHEFMKLVKTDAPVIAAVQAHTEYGVVNNNSLVIEKDDEADDNSDGAASEGGESVFSGIFCVDDDIDIDGERPDEVPDPLPAPRPLGRHAKRNLRRRAHGQVSYEVAQSIARNTMELPEHLWPQCLQLMKNSLGPDSFNVFVRQMLDVPRTGSKNISRKRAERTKISETLAATVDAVRAQKAPAPEVLNRDRPQDTATGSRNRNASPNGDLDLMTASLTRSDGSAPGSYGITTHPAGYDAFGPVRPPPVVVPDERPPIQLSVVELMRAYRSECEKAEPSSFRLCQIFAVAQIKSTRLKQALPEDFPTQATHKLKIESLATNQTNLSPGPDADADRVADPQVVPRPPAPPGVSAALPTPAPSGVVTDALTEAEILNIQNHNDVGTTPSIPEAQPVLTTHVRAYVGFTTQLACPSESGYSDESWQQSCGPHGPSATQLMGPAVPLNPFTPLQPFCPPVPMRASIATPSISEVDSASIAEERAQRKRANITNAVSLTDTEAESESGLPDGAGLHDKPQSRADDSHRWANGILATQTENSSPPQMNWGFSPDGSARNPDNGDVTPTPDWSNALSDNEIPSMPSDSSIPTRPSEATIPSDGSRMSIVEPTASDGQYVSGSDVSMASSTGALPVSYPRARTNLQRGQWGPAHNTDPPGLHSVETALPGVKLVVSSDGHTSVQKLESGSI